LAINNARVVLPKPGCPYKRVCSKGSFLKMEASMAILKEDLSCSWPINSFKETGRAKFRLLFLCSSGMIFESTSLSSFYEEKSHYHLCWKKLLP